MIEPLKLPAKQIQLVEDYLAGVSLNNIAEKHSMTPEEVADIINSKPVTNFITAYLKNYSYLNPLKRVNLLEKLIENKVKDGIQTKKDILDIIKLLQDEYKLLDKTEVTQNNYINLINELIVE